LQKISGMAISYHEHNINANLKERRRLSAFITNLILSKRKNTNKINLQYIFCDDQYLLEINKQFLNHDTLTDIITFDLSETQDVLEGEIYISIERIKENAIQFSNTYQQEVHRVIFHGALHLCGYKDKRKDDKVEMTKQEDICLNQYFA